MSVKQKSRDMSKEEAIVALDQLPDDPLSMPPPYWRGSGAIFHILESLNSIPLLLQELIPLLEKTEGDFDAHFKSQRNRDDDHEMEEFARIGGPLWDLEVRIKLQCEIVILMSAIEAEEITNRFCVFNLPKDIAEPIEKLSLPDKLLIASSFVGSKAKSSAVFGEVRRLTTWRNAFAHGHCVDRPVRSLRHNHLIHPASYPDVPGTILEMKQFVAALLDVDKFLGSISKNSYTAGAFWEMGEIKKYMKKIDRFVFHVEKNQIYLLEYQSAP